MNINPAPEQLGEMLHEPSSTINRLFCPKCGQTDDGPRSLRSRHYSRGKLCDGIPVTVTYVRAAVAEPRGDAWVEKEIAHAAGLSNRGRFEEASAVLVHALRAAATASPAPSSSVALTATRPIIDVTTQHDFVQIKGSDRCGLRGCELGVLGHAWMPPWSGASSPVPAESRALYSELIHIAAELARGTDFLSTCAEDMNPRLKRADILKTAERQEEKLKDWAYRVRQVADKLLAVASPESTRVAGEQEERETFAMTHFTFDWCIHSMVKPDCPSCCRSHAARAEMQLGKLKASTALPVRERIERAVRKQMEHCYEVYKGVPPSVDDWVGGALHYVMWGIERDLPLTNPSDSARRAAAEIQNTISRNRFNERGTTTVEIAAIISKCFAAATPADNDAEK